MSIKKIIICTGLFILSTISSTWSQTVYSSTGNKNNNISKKIEKKGFDKEKLIFGGGFFGGGSGSIISIGVSPIAGYRLTDFWSAGISLGYKYYFYRDYFSVYNVNKRPEPGYVRL
jgi:hypothetical protein